MPYSPSALPAVSRVTVGTSAVDVNLPTTRRLKLGVLLLQRSADSGTVYWGTSDTITTSTGALVAKGSPGVTSTSLIPLEYFDGTNTFYLIGSGAGQLVDVVMI